MSKNSLKSTRRSFLRLPSPSQKAVDEDLDAATQGHTDVEIDGTH